MEVKKGYKQTEIGIIPEEWEIKKIGEISNIDPESLCANTNPNYALKYISLEDVDSGKLLNISELIFKNAPSRARRIINKQDILISTVRPNLKSHLLIKHEVKGWICSTGFSVIRCKELINPYFIFYHLFFSTINIQINNLISGSNYPAISKKDIELLKIPLPPLHEQTAIANALSDIDALIESIEKLITKRRNIKLGTMQQLLTGKKRLPGFGGDGISRKGYIQTEIGIIPEDWEVKTIGSFGIFRSGNGFPILYQGDNEGDYPFFKVSDMNNEKNKIFMLESNNWISEQIKKQICIKTFPKYTIIFAKIGAAIYLERRKIIFQESCIDNNLMGFTLIDVQGYYKFFYYLLLNIHFGNFVEATALPSLDQRHIAKLKFGIPKIEEQTAIAKVLSDMDSEIEALEKKLNKYKKVKQGMMQELLTGKKRLI